MKFDYDSRFRKSVERVRHKAFQLLYKSLSDGLPPNNELGNSLWHTDVVSLLLDEKDSKKVERLALEVEEEAFRAIIDLFLEPGFLPYLKKDMVAAHARGLKKSKKGKKGRDKTSLEKYLMSNRDLLAKRTKTILKELENLGKIVQEGSAYLIVDEDKPARQWKTLQVATMASKFSRLRTELSLE